MDMKGYLAFLLVFASVFLILSLIAAASEAPKITFSRAIAAERAYQVQMNAKEVVLEGVRQGGVRGYGAYNASFRIACCGDCATVPRGPRCPECFRYPDAVAAAQAGAFSEIASMGGASFDQGMNVTIWCQQGMGRDMADAIAAKSLPGGANGSGCEDAILPILGPDADPNENPHLEELRAVQDIVIMVDYPAFNITAVSWIPAGYKVEP
jgi:hypothetical protein